MRLPGAPVKCAAALLGPRAQLPSSGPRRTRAGKRLLSKRPCDAARYSREGKRQPSLVGKPAAGFSRRAPGAATASRVLEAIGGLRGRGVICSREVDPRSARRPLEPAPPSPSAPPSSHPGRRRLRAGGGPGGRAGPCRHCAWTRPRFTPSTRRLSVGSEQANSKQINLLIRPRGLYNSRGPSRRQHDRRGQGVALADVPRQAGAGHALPEDLPELLLQPGVGREVVAPRARLAHSQVITRI